MRSTTVRYEFTTNSKRIIQRQWAWLFQHHSLCSMHSRVRRWFHYSYFSSF